MVGPSGLAHRELLQAEILLEGSDDVVHHLAQVVASLEGDRPGASGPHVLDQDGRNAVELRGVGLGVGQRPVTALLLTREEDESDRPPGPYADGLQRPGGLDDGHGAGPVVGGAGAEVPRIEVGTEDDQLVGLLPAHDLGDRIVDLDFAVTEPVRISISASTGPRLRSRQMRP